MRLVHSDRRGGINTVVYRFRSELLREVKSRVGARNRKRSTTMIATKHVKGHILRKILRKLIVRREASERVTQMTIISKEEGQV